MRLYAIETGNFKLDGGAMFGVVPKAIKQKTNPADSQNRIDMAARSLLIENEGRLILIDTGLGNKQSEKFFSRYGLWGPHCLETSLAACGFSKDEITDVVFTHLHFDHCGGAIKRRSDGQLIPNFPNAQFWCHEDHWDWASHPNPREKASFLPENIRPIQDSGQLCFLKGNAEELINTPLGIDFLVVNGHTEKQLLPKLNYHGKTLLFAADLVPTAGHVPLAYVMGYDTRPLLTIKEKAKVLQRASDNDWFLFLQHDPYNEIITLQETDRGIRLANSLKFDSLFT